MHGKTEFIFQTKHRRRPERLRTVRAALNLAGKNNERGMATGMVVLKKPVSSESY
ncbi:hypothetical protein ACYHMX_13515 [Pseudomonas amygdali pv. morsprunorum]|uniref:Uncharacterized protein n=1 Tax=Pseudomonas amygdali pv. morsprunorum TaxID=129138 RepID=A0AB35R8E1_PSEA0|nr:MULTISPECIES: hypothetical protein [Pseudomonas syringae group]MDT3244287.1 hypothetical protein [Pseudomonas amygdali pv. morsprunorum]MDT3269063.1 hypothetical protein [Pseudomonas amygdali pv. morsprunorum]